MSRIARAASCTWPSRRSPARAAAESGRLISTIASPERPRAARRRRARSCASRGPAPHRRLTASAPARRPRPSRARSAGSRWSGAVISAFSSACRSLASKLGMARQHRHRRLDQGRGAPRHWRRARKIISTVTSSRPGASNRNRSPLAAWRSRSRLAGELGLGHVGHADHMASPRFG